jgi:hypothetical protein
MSGDAAGVVGIVERAAAAGVDDRQVAVQAALVPELHGEANDSAGLALGQQRGGGGGVHSATHGDEIELWPLVLKALTTEAEDRENQNVPTSLF